MTDLNKLPLKNYNLHSTLMGGQSFGWDFDGEFYYGFTIDRAVKLKLRDDELLWQTYPVRDDFEFLKNYLRLDVDYKNIIQKINKDSHTQVSIERFPNLRLLKQDFEETTLSFIISAFNNIKKIRMSIRFLNEKLGDKVKIGNKEIFLFPKMEVLADASLETLQESKLGYRAKYVKSAARYLSETDLSNKIANLSEQEAREELKKINGIGEKVADCILTFSLAFDNVTPVDVWARRVFTDLYQLDPKMKPHEMRKWINEYFENYGAWAGQFLFEYIRTEKKR